MWYRVNVVHFVCQIDMNDGVVILESSNTLVVMEYVKCCNYQMPTILFLTCVSTFPFPHTNPSPFILPINALFL